MDKHGARVRPIEPRDLPRYVPLRLAALRDHPTAFGSSYEDQCNDPPDVWLGRLKNALEGENARLFVAEAEDGDLVGLCGVFREPGSKVRHAGIVYSVYVRPAWRGRGVIEQLMAGILEWSRQHGIVILRLQVTTTNDRAVRCYQRLGFRRTGIMEKYIRTPDGAFHDEYLMTRDL